MKQYLKLLMIREGKEVLGHHGANLWLLTIVLVATFASIAFSEGSMLYLQQKMEDPFTNWVDIPIDGSNERFKAFEQSLNDAQIMNKYNYDDVHGDREEYYDMQTDKYLRCRHFSTMNSSLVNAILSEENIVNGCVADSVKMTDQSLGVIITADALRKLGESVDSIPSYIYYKAYNQNADTLGLELMEGKFLLVPIPVLAVVRRLPNNVDMMGTNYLSEQPNNDIKYPFDFNKHLDYIQNLLYFVPGDIKPDVFADRVRTAFPDSVSKKVQCIEENLAQIDTWMNGKQLSLNYGSMPPSFTTQQWLAIDRKIQSICKDLGIVRIYNYDTGENSNIPDRYVSLTFKNLDHIREFEDYAKTEHQVQIDMSLVASKENFNSVTVMAAILSAAMVIFSMVCIIMFMVNMLQSYFQKVKRNIGTFKAFGMNAGELIQVYVIILIMIVLTAVIMALVITWCIQIALPLIGIQKEGFNYLSLWNTTTYIAAAVVLVSTVATVCVVMSRMLSQTPGDLIYDRN